MEETLEKMAAEEKLLRQELIRVSDLEHGLSKAFEKLKSDVHANDERHRRALAEIYGHIRSSMREIETHKREVDGLTKNMAETAHGYLVKTEQ